jgi:hypothetical protein
MEDGTPVIISCVSITIVVGVSSSKIFEAKIVKK